MAISALMCLIAVFGPSLTPYDPNQPDYANAFAAPSATYLLGTDQTGRDQFSRLLDGAHRSLGAALLVLATVFGVGLFVGMVSGMVGGWLDVLLMRTVDIFLALPNLVLAIAIVGVLGPSFFNLLLAIVIADWAYYARLARSFVLTARQRPDVIAARLAGIPWWRILLGHIFPEVASQLGVIATLGLGNMIAVISGLSFLGLGVQPPYAEWGAMLSEARLYFSLAPWLLIAPTVSILLCVIGANLAGNALRDALETGKA